MGYTDWLWVREVLRVDFVNGGKVVHVGEEDIDLHRLGEA